MAQINGFYTIAVPTAVPLDQWFIDACHYDILTKRISNGDLDQLSKPDQAFLADYISRNGMLHLIANKNPELLERLVKAGVDINAIDSEGDSVLSKIKNRTVFNWLLEKGAIYGPKGSPLTHAIQEWPQIDVITEILRNSSIDEISKLDRKTMITVFLVTPELSELFIHVISKMAQEKPQCALDIARVLSEQDPDRLIWVMQHKSTTANFIKLVSTDPTVIYLNIKYKDFFSSLSKHSSDSKDNVCCKALLNSKTLREAAFVLSCLNYFIITQDLAENILSHIKSLQINEKSTIWIAMRNLKLNKTVIGGMIALGLDPKWEEPYTKHTLLFTNSIKYLAKVDLSAMGFNIEQKDNQGENALEYHCHKLKTRCIIPLVKHGLKLSDQFPNVELCRKTFPNNMTLQSFLAMCLIATRKPLLQFLFKRFQDLEPELSIDKLRSIDELKIIANKIDLEPKLDPIDLPAVNLIPQSPAASLVVHTLIHQKELPPKILFKNFLHDDIVYFYHYIFAHPNILKNLIRTYMKVKYIQIQPGGGTISSHAKLVMTLIDKMGKLIHIPNKITNFPENIQKILSAFKAVLPATPVETLQIPIDIQPLKQGRTIVLDKKDHLECFKFLNTEENYSHFSQEYSVSDELHQTQDMFKSEFIKPLGLYAVRNLPPAFDIYKNSFPSGRPTYIFHYKSNQGKYDYLQNLPNKKYLKARFACLYDSAKLVKIGIYPDSAPLFHNEGQNRRYVILVDLLVKTLKKNSGYDPFSPAGGAGRLDQPFTKIKYPNLTEIGLTDTRDAMTYHMEPDEEHFIHDMKLLKEDSLYFQQMEALARILLVDILILIERWKHNLNWQNETLLKVLGDDIAQGFAYIFVGYADKSLNDCQHFIRESGIDWTLAAKQIAFWVDIGPKGYPSWLAQNKVPEGLYENTTNVVVDTSKAKNFDPDTGCTTNGHQDIGLYNGPLGLTEIEKAMHLLVFAVGLAEPIGANT